MELIRFSFKQMYYKLNCFINCQMCRSTKVCFMLATKFQVGMWYLEFGSSSELGIQFICERASTWKGIIVGFLTPNLSCPKNKHGNELSQASCKISEGWKHSLFLRTDVYDSWNELQSGGSCHSPLTVRGVLAVHLA